ncbi:MAG: DUF692 domain-containing protein [Gammaproteobacteria bacterium]|nr:DUF692 domain-containing protein [Gammaproteobacteria bacterium]
MIQGLGLGFRFKYLENLQTQAHSIHWLELLVDHFHDLDAPIVAQVDALLTSYPCVLHGVNFSLGGSDPLNPQYLDLVQRQIERFNPVWISDHLCFSQVGTLFLHDLLPIPFTNAMLDHVAFKIDFLQEQLKRPFLIENISSYVRLKGSEMSEAQFIAKLVHKTGCGILLDVNNVVVTCHNHQESIAEFCDALPWSQVKQMHIAGAIHQNNLLVDTHNQPIAEGVMGLYQQIQKQHGPIPTCLEWDSDLPAFSVILDEIARCQHVCT